MQIQGRKYFPKYQIHNDYADIISELLISGFGDEIVDDIKYQYILSGVSYFINKRKAFEISNTFGISLFFNDRFYKPCWSFEYDSIESKEDFRRMKNLSNEKLLLIQDDIFELCEVFLMFGSNNLYDCCDLFEKCSDQMNCFHKNQKRARFCTYRRKLKKGIVFIGKNRNID